MLNYIPDVQQRGQRWKLNSTFSTRALWHWVEWCRAFGTLALWSMARRDWSKVNQCICWLYHVGPSMLLQSYWTRLHMCTYIYIRPFRHAEKISQSQAVISSISIIKITASCPFFQSHHLYLIAGKKTEQRRNTQPLAQCQEYYFGGDIFYDTPANTGFGTPRPTCETPGDLLRVSKSITLLLPRCFGERYRYCWILVAVCLYLKVLCLDLRLLGIFSHLPGITSGMTTKTSKYRLPAFIRNKIQYILLIHPP